MKVILPVVVVFISGVSSFYLKCPNSSGKFPIENSLCKSYYECQNWKVTNQHSCPQEQNFNPVQQRCDYEELYYCAEGALNKYKICKKSAGKFPKENSSCRTYYECEKWKVTGEFTCPLGQNFNPEQQWCDWDEIYPCLEDKPSTKCPKPSGLFPLPGSQCKRYIQCINGKAHEFECPNDLNFDPRHGQCEWPELYLCEETEGSTGTPENTKTVGTSEDFTTSETTTEEIVSPTEKSTSVPTKEISQYTETESTVDTTEGPTFTSTIEQTSEGTEKEETVVTTEIYTTPSTEGGSSRIETEGTTRTNEDLITVFTRETSTDIETDEVTSEKYTTTTVEETEGTTKTTVVDTTRTTDLTVPVSEVDTTRTTDLTVPVSKTGGTVLTTVSDEKSTVSNATTKTSTVTTTYGTISVPTEISDEIITCPEANGLFPHPTDKHKFLACLDFMPTEMECPEDLIYDPNLEACIWNKRMRL